MSRLKKNYFQTQTKICNDKYVITLKYAMSRVHMSKFMFKYILIYVQKLPLNWLIFAEM